MTTTDPTLQAKIAADEAAIAKDGGPSLPANATASACRACSEPTMDGSFIASCSEPLRMESVLTTPHSPGWAGKTAWGLAFPALSGVIDVSTGKWPARST